MAVDIKDMSKEQMYAELQGKEFTPATQPANVNDTPPATPPATPPSNDDLPPELDDAALLALLKNKGISVESLEALKPQPTPEEIQQAQQKRKAEMVAFGLSSGKFNQEQYDNFIRESADKIAVIKVGLTEKIKAANPDLSEDDIAEKVSLYTLAHLPADDVLRVEREQELIEMAEGKLQKKYAGIYNLESDYENHQRGINDKAAFEAKVLAATPQLQNDVATVMAGLREFEVPVPDTQNPANTVNVKVSFNDADLAEMSNAFLTPEQIERRVRKGYTKEQLESEIKAALYMQHLPRIISKAAKDYHSFQKDKYLAGRKGVLPHLELGLSETPEITDDVKLQYEQLKQSAGSPVMAKPN
jgi:hypothetical protein